MPVITLIDEPFSKQRRHTFDLFVSCVQAFERDMFENDILFTKLQFKCLVYSKYSMNKINLIPPLMGLLFYI